ncbi:hypothetical protein ACRRTK_010206 [Alexandromys fortis]
MNNHENVAPPGVILHGGDALPSLGEQKRHLRPHPMYHHQSGKALIPKLCSKGAALGKPFDAHAEDIASVASFIETKLVTCYLRMRKPDLALNHAHSPASLNKHHQYLSREQREPEHVKMF